MEQTDKLGEPTVWTCGACGTDDVAEDRTAALDDLAAHVEHCERHGDGRDSRDRLTTLAEALRQSRAAHSTG